MPWEISSVTVPTRRLLYGTAVGLLFSIAGGSNANAVCSGLPTDGTANVVDCTGGTDNAFGVNGQGGDDTLSNNGDELQNFQGGVGDDTITLNSGTMVNGITGNGNDDTITMTGGTVLNNGVGGATGNDVIIVTAGTNNVGFGGQEGDDAITVTGGLATQIDGGDGADDITFAGGDASLGINGDNPLEGANDGADNIVMTGGGALFVFGQGGADVMLLTGGSINGNGSVAVLGGAGDDFTSIGGSMGIFDLVSGGSGADTITMSGGSVQDAITGDGEDDDLIVTGGFVAGNGAGTTGVNGGNQNDFVFIGGTATLGTTTTAADVLGGQGDDTIELSGTAIVNGDAIGSVGADTVTLSGAQVSGSLDGEQGADIFVLSSGSANQVLAGADADTVTLNGATITAFIDGDGGSDTFFMTSGQTGTMLGGGAADQISLGGGSVTDSVMGEDGDDIITLSGTASIANALRSGSGNDTMFLASATSAGDTVSGDSGNDSIFVTGGFAGALSGVNSLAGGIGTDSIDFEAVISQLGSGFEGFEIITLDQNAQLNVFDGTNDLRVIQGDGGSDVAIGLLNGAQIVAAGNSPGVLSIVGNVGADGSGGFNMIDGDADDQVTISGDYAGFNAIHLMDVALDATELADQLIIGDAVTDVTVGTLIFTNERSFIQVNDVGAGPGVLTGDGPGAGIALVDVSNTGLTNADDFALANGPIQKGAVEYDLSLESDGIWYLQSEFVDQIFAFAAAPTAALAMGQDYLGSTLRQRVGTREQTWTGGAVQSSEGAGAWMRGGGASEEVTGDTVSYDQSRWFAQVGADFPLMVSPEGSRLIGGLFAHYGTSEVEARDETGTDVAKANIDAWGGGLSLTWYGSGDGTGFYADLVGQVSMYNADMKANDTGAGGETDGWGFGVSMEAGWAFTVAKNVRLIPQAQLTYSRVSLDSFTDDSGVDVDYGDADSLEARAGFAVDTGKMWRSGNVSFTASVVHEFLGESELTVSTVDADNDISGTSAQMGIAGTVSLLDNISLYASVDYRVPFDQGRDGVTASGGIRLSW